MLSKKGIVAIAVIIVLLSVVGYSFYNFNGNSFDLTDRQVLLVVTDSMDGDVTEYEIDSFPKNTFVMIEHLSAEEKLQLKIGDVISFWQGDILTQHRVIEIHFDQGYVVTHGDNTHANETVELHNINGKVIGTSHLMGVLVSFVKENFLIIIAVIAIVAIAGEIYRAYSDGVFRKEE